MFFNISFLFSLNSECNSLCWKKFLFIYVLLLAWERGLAMNQGISGKLFNLFLFFVRHFLSRDNTD